MALILDLILRVPIRSREFSAPLGQYLGRHTEHFVHEFFSYATAPYDLRDYDRLATYVHQPNLALYMFRMHPIASSSSDDELQVKYLRSTI